MDATDNSHVLPVGRRLADVAGSDSMQLLRQQGAGRSIWHGAGLRALLRHVDAVQPLPATDERGREVRPAHGRHCGHGR